MLTYRNINTSGEIVNWRHIKWLHYKKRNPYVLFYKNELNSEQYHEINCLKRGKHNPKLIAPQCYLFNISAKKNKIYRTYYNTYHQLYKEFYMNIKTKNSIRKWVKSTF